MIDTTPCPLCASTQVRDYARDDRRSFLLCQACSLVFVPFSQMLSEEDEKRRYDLHRNVPTDPGYRGYLSRLLVPLQDCISPGSQGLDFGSGPSPTLSLMLEEAGYRVSLYDRYYAPDPAAFEHRYDFITASEVVEHLQQPKEELDRLWACLRTGGTLAVMTQFLVDPSEFLRWHYKNDPTHVCFFSPRTFAWLADQWDAELILPARDVVLLRKKPGAALQCDPSPSAAPLTVLYRDEHLVAINKPVGLLAHRSDIDRHATENAMYLLRDQLGQWVYPLHRLDRSTSGVMVFALDKEIARTMTQSFIDHQVSKHYLAVVRGYTEEAGRIDHALKDPWDKMTDRKTASDKPARAAVTEYQRLATIELPHPVGRYATARYSLVKAMPLTGRPAQIRRHLKHIFHPIVGDTTYGDGKQNAFFRQTLDCRRMLLHACEIAFTHPYTKERMRITAPLDHAFNSIMKALQWDAVDLKEITS